MAWTVDSANAAYEQFKEKASQDAQFKSLALADPAAAVKQLTGEELPQDVELSIKEDASGELVFETRLTGERELDESQLEAVTGGTSFSAFILYGPPYEDSKK